MIQILLQEENDYLVLYNKNFILGHYIFKDDILSSMRKMCGNYPIVLDNNAVPELKKWTLPDVYT